jgi:hypothetical protein
MGTGGTESRSWVGWVVAAAITAGSVGVGLRLADSDSGARAPLVLLFLAMAPTTAIYGLLRSFDPFARILLACTVNVVFLTLTATVMLAEGVWSPTGGLAVVAGITAVCLLAQWTPVRQRVTGALPARRQAKPEAVDQTNVLEGEAE